MAITANGTPPPAIYTFNAVGSKTRLAREAAQRDSAYNAQVRVCARCASKTRATLELLPLEAGGSRAKLTRCVGR